MGYSVEKEKDGPNYVIVDDEGEQLGDTYGTRRAAIRSLGEINKMEAAEAKRKGKKKPENESAEEDEDEE